MKRVIKGRSICALIRSFEYQSFCDLSIEVNFILSLVITIIVNRSYLLMIANRWRFNPLSRWRHFLWSIIQIKYHQPWQAKAISIEFYENNRESSAIYTVK